MLFCYSAWYQSCFCGCKIFERPFIPTNFAGILHHIYGVVLAGFQKRQTSPCCSFSSSPLFLCFCYNLFRFLFFSLIEFNAKCYSDLIRFLSYFNVFLFYSRSSSGYFAIFISKLVVKNLKII